MRIGIDPTVDYVFKKIFGTEENKELLLDPINAILEDNKKEKVEEIQLLNPYNPKEFETDKLSIVDIKAKDSKGEWFIIEMQVIMNKFYPKRLLYYWARMYHDQMKKKEQYEILKKTTVISISKAELPIGTKKYANQYKILCVRDKRTVFCDDLEIYTIELSKFSHPSKDIKKQVERWTYFFKNGEDLDDTQLPKCMEEPKMATAIKELKKFSMDEIERNRYEDRRMALMDEHARISSSYLDGIEKGRLEGEQIGIQKGEQIGIQKGKLEGKLEGIEALLEVKFGEKSLCFMKQICEITDLDKMTQVQKAIKRAKNVHEFETMLKKIV